VAVKATALSAIDMALKGGTVVIVGVPAADFELPIRIMQDQQIRLQGSATYVPQDYVAAIEMIQSGQCAPRTSSPGSFLWSRLSRRSRRR
jgi:threonine dehydrogenase-like Zn-dependent dehydrogenase